MMRTPLAYRFADLPASWSARAPLAPQGMERSNQFPLFDDIRDEFVVAGLVDRDIDVTLTPGGPDAPVMAEEAKANMQVVEAVAQAADWLQLDDEIEEIEEIEISRKNRVDIIRPLDPSATMCLYVSLDRAKAQFSDTTKMRVEMVELAFGL